MRAVIGSYSMPVSRVVLRSSGGSSAKNRPVPMPGSSTRPPENPRCRAARQSARTIGSGVKCAYWVDRRSAANSAGEASVIRVRPVSSQPSRKVVAPGSGKQFCASSVAPKPVKRSSCACSSGVAGRSEASNSLDRRMAARLSRARAFQPRASERSVVR